MKGTARQGHAEPPVAGLARARRIAAAGPAQPSLFVTGPAPQRGQRVVRAAHASEMSFSLMAAAGVSRRWTSSATKRFAGWSAAQACFAGSERGGSSRSSEALHDQHGQHIQAAGDRRSGGFVERDAADNGVARSVPSTEIDVIEGQRFVLPGTLDIVCGPRWRLRFAPNALHRRRPRSRSRRAVRRGSQRRRSVCAGPGGSDDGPSEPPGRSGLLRSVTSLRRGSIRSRASARLRSVEGCDRLRN